jgi:hypothetical protein
MLNTFWQAPNCSTLRGCNTFFNLAKKLTSNKLKNAKICFVPLGSSFYNKLKALLCGFTHKFSS